MQTPELPDDDDDYISVLLQTAIEDIDKEDYQVEAKQTKPRKPRKLKKQLGEKLNECETPGCRKQARGSSGLCRSHGGGIPCTAPGCNRMSRLAGRCSVHGGYHTCSVEGCTRVSQICR